MAPSPSAKDLAALSELVDKRMGLSYPVGKWPELARAIAAAAPQAGFSSRQHFLSAILSGSATDQQVGHFETCLTIGETYFMRDPRSFEALERYVLPELVRSSRAPGGLRILSAGCSDGAEPYSIAIVCRRALPLYGSPPVSILAVDIDRRALERARKGVYTKWALRESSDALVRDCFVSPVSEKFELKREIRSMVRFEHVNLASKVPSPWDESGGLDIIFCRNTLMYFSPGQCRMAADKLQRSLAVGGYLFVAPSEVSQALFPDLELVRVAGVFCYRKPDPKTKTPARTESKTSPQRSVSLECITAKSRPSVHRPRLAPAARSPKPAVTSAESPTRSVADDLARAKSLADGGRAAEALLVLECASADIWTSAPAHFLHATILQELGRADESADALRHVLYLEPDFVLAHFILGNLSAHAGDLSNAAKQFTTVNKLLDGAPDDTVLPDSDGTTVGEIRAMMPDLPGRR